MIRRRTAPSWRGEQGFTLIELIVVVVIVGILAAVAVPIYVNQQKSARDTSVISDVRNTSVSAARWVLEHDKTAVLNTADYLSADGKIVQSDANVIDVTTSGTGTYTVCGYTAGGNKYNSNTSAYLYDSTTSRAAMSTAGCPGDGVTSAPAPTTPTSGSSTSGTSPSGSSGSGLSGSGTSAPTASTPSASTPIASASASASPSSVATPTPSASSTPAVQKWIDCAAENETCSFTGTHSVRYGVAPSSYATKTATNGIACNNSVFGDPAYGYGKRCAYLQ